MDSSKLDNLLIVLVGTTHPGNIGAVARAMKTMGLRRLSLVGPKHFPSAQASARAAGADDVLYGARVFESLPAALTDCHWVVGTSARVRSIPWPELTPRACAQRAMAAAGAGRVALVFGREHSGLTNEELDQCQAVVRIPTDPAYHSLNLASAVQVVSYELRMALLSGLEGEANPVGDEADADRADGVGVSEWAGFFRHLAVSLEDIGYYDPAKPKRLMRRLRRLFHRARPDRSEMNILRGILSAAQKAARSNSPGTGENGSQG
uniref:tRNA (cytidine/uridine-2'-O-)-methyltransferase TrmJ n=1 Tax=Candidatus Kentrum eta TaxID=2126337 RepID=A0A450UD72_9GAMM|nr:MAG: tRNA (cytidine32/uridine32-2'-O)-methyltransferase [Candidatus Kentron sp. H]VFJ90368.1 MAG: tRNA (cytidine32/uridine32-2'-O)-methyltransferase [Candidatus Kentron sp. H]VFJ97020.1 MAG: tRNA (cytidine32/uridine32-2'-O)-methyltransferase [Candidatus Kentron sp. H]